MRFSARVFLFCFVLTVFSGPAAARSFAVETSYLDNGLQIVVIENRRAPVVTHMLWYKYGAADERPGKSGIAHFLEHLMFKGTAKHPGQSLTATVRRLGGNDNAFTSHDFTAYYQNIAREHLAKVMEMEADRMHNLTLTPAEVAAERQVIIEERRQRIDNQPFALFYEQMMAALFVNHPYGLPVIGWLHEMQELTLDDAQSIYQKWYAPNNAILVVAGDITMKDLKPLAQKYYGDLPVSDIEPRQRARPAPIISQQRLVMEDPRVGAPLVIKAYRAPRGSDAVDVLSEIIGGTSTARLYRNLVVRDRLAVSASVSYDPISLNETTFVIQASPAPNISPAQLEAAIDREITLILEKGVTLEELNTAKSRKAASFAYFLDSLQGPALLFGRALASGFDIDFIQNRLDRIEKLTLEDINDAANRIFRGDNRPIVGLLTLPLESSSKPRSGRRITPAGWGNR